jgi:hypothetical protein
MARPSLDEIFGAPQGKPEQSFFEGVKLGNKKRALGIAELGANAIDALGIAPESIAYAKQLMADVGQDYAKQGTGTGLKGGVAEILGDPLTFLPGATLGKVAAQGALMGATAPTGDANSNLVNNAINAAGGAAASGLGYGAGKVISKVAKPIGNQLTEIGKAGVRKLESAGVPLTAAQKTGSKALAALEATFSALPMTSSAQGRIFEKQREAFTKAALKEAGIDANNASREVIAAASKKFGDEYSALASKNIMNIDEPLLEGVAKAYDDATNGVLGVDASSLVKKVAKDIFDSKGAIDGKVYQKTRSMLTQASQTAKTHEATVLKQLRNELDAAFERSLPESQRGIMANINRRYQAFKPIQKAMESSKAEGLKTGNIDPTALYNKVEVGAPLSDLSDAAAGFLRPTIPDSGTAQRLFMQNALTGAGVASAGYGAGTDNNLALGAGLALAGPKAAQLLYNSGRGQKYLTEGMRPAIQAGANAAARGLPPAIASGVTLNEAAAPTIIDVNPNQPNPYEQELPAVNLPQPRPSLDEIFGQQSSLSGKIKQAESGGNPNAKNPLSSASGLYQFTDSTWRSAVDKWGRSRGIKYSDKNNPQAQEMLMQKLTADNSRILKAKGIEPTDGNIYFAHFMGAPAASKAINMLGKGAIAARSFPSEARANPTIFFNQNGQPRTVDQVYEIITSKVV